MPREVIATAITDLILSENVTEVRASRTELVAYVRPSQDETHIDAWAAGVESRLRELVGKLTEEVP